MKEYKLNLIDFYSFADYLRAIFNKDKIINLMCDYAI